jgi:hypothetical protein
MLVAFLHSPLVPLADVRGIDAELFADQLGPGLGPQIGEVVVSFPFVVPLGALVLADQHERGQEDRLERDDQRQQAERETVERVLGPDVVPSPGPNVLLCWSEAGQQRGARQAGPRPRLSERGASSGRIRDDDFVPNGTVRAVWAKVRLLSIL